MAFFKADGADVFDNRLKDLYFVVTRIQDLDLVDGEERDDLGCVGHQDAVPTFGCFLVISAAPFPADADALGHAVKEAEVFEAKDVKGDAGAVAETDFLPGQIEPVQ